MIAGFFSFLVNAAMKLVPVALVIAAFLFGAFQVKKILLADTHLKVQEIRVAPPDVLSPKSIRILEDKYLGKNVLGIDLKEVAAQIELGPGAQSVRVTRELPSTLRIEIRKRKPVANVLLKPGGNFAVVAEDGVVIAASALPDPAWILMEDFSEPYKEPKIGARIQNKGFVQALRFLAEFNRHELSRRERVTKVSLDSYGNVTVRLGEGPDFQMGRHPQEKVPMLAKSMYLFKTEPREGIEYLDLQFDRVAVKRKKG